MTCCDDYKCKRSHPMHLRRAALTGGWMVTTAEKDGVAVTRHWLPADEAQQLTDAFEAKAWLDAVIEETGSRDAILDGLGIWVRPAGEAVPSDTEEQR